MYKQGELTAHRNAVHSTVSGEGGLYSFLNVMIISSPSSNLLRSTIASLMLLFIFLRLSTVCSIANIINARARPHAYVIRHRTLRCVSAAIMLPKLRAMFATFTIHQNPNETAVPQRRCFIYLGKYASAIAKAAAEITIAKMLKNIVLPLLKKSEPFAGLQKVNIYISIYERLVKT